MALPQGFKNSPILCGEALGKDLRDLHLEKGMLLQCVDDILIASPSKDYQTGTPKYPKPLG